MPVLRDSIPDRAQSTLASQTAKPHPFWSSCLNSKQPTADEIAQVAFEIRESTARAQRSLEVERADVQVCQARDRLRFAVEAGAAVGVSGDAGGKNLDRHGAIEARVVGLVDLADAPGADQTEVRDQSREVGTSGGGAAPCDVTRAAGSRAQPRRPRWCITRRLRCPHASGTLLLFGAAVRAGRDCPHGADETRSGSSGRRAGAQSTEGAPPQKHLGTRAALRAVVSHPSARLGVTAMAVGHLVMIGIMAMTPVHIRSAGHDAAHTLRNVGVVLSIHIAGMFAFAPAIWMAHRSLRAASTHSRGIRIAAHGVRAGRQRGTVLDLHLDAAPCGQQQPVGPSYRVSSIAAARGQSESASRPSIARASQK